MGKKLKGLLLALVVCLQAVVPVVKADAATVLYNNATGSEGSYNYELWKDYGDTSMTLKGNGLFECWWENIGNALFRNGIYTCKSAVHRRKYYIPAVLECTYIQAYEQNDFRNRALQGLGTHGYADGSDL